ncbi:MAG: hypothetical protein F4X20_03060 [Dehalococcoidia bacterium]|nr:hypothetical protein [Dehalococcoidia bacterium]
MVSLALQTWYIYLRNFRAWITQPGQFLPTIFINIIFMVVFVAAFDNVSMLPGFPTDSYVTYLMPMIIVQAMIFSGIDAGFNLLTDDLSGYLNKLLLAPIYRIAILLGVLLVSATRGAIQGVTIIAVGLLMGASSESGMLGLLFVLLLGTLFGVAWSCLGLIIAIRTRSVQVTQSMFIFFFPAVFMTTAFMPKDLMAEWFQVAVSVNPVNYVMEAIRAIVVVGWEWEHILPGMSILVVMTIAALTATTILYRRATA